MNFDSESFPLNKCYSQPIINYRNVKWVERVVCCWVCYLFTNIVLNDIKLTSLMFGIV